MLIECFKRTKASGADKPRVVGQKPPLKLKEIWAIRMHLQLTGQLRELVLFNLAIDSKLRACDLVKLRVQDVYRAGQVVHRAIVMQQKTKRPVQFEITEQTRAAVATWIQHKRMVPGDYLFTSRVKSSPHLSRRQYARLLAKWLTAIGLDPRHYGTHSLRRTKASLIYKRTKNLRAVQLLLGHARVESTVRYLGVEVDDALELAEQTEV